MKPKIDNQYPIDENIAKRWSGRAYSHQSVDRETLLSLFEAARWSASSFNEQPWKFIVGVKGDAHYDQILDTLGEFNRNWAQEAPVLVLTIARKHFEKNEKPNLHSWYDTGQAMANLSIQATELDLNVHQMAGYDRDKAQESIVKDTAFEPVCVAAIGYRGEAESLPDGLKEKELAKQERKPLSQIVDML